MQVYPEHKKVVIPYRADVEQLLLPAAQRFQHGGVWYLAIPHEIGTVRLLRNLGLSVPSPIQYYYDWVRGSPFDSQRVTADMCTIARRAYVLSEMGVGKTRAVLYAYDYLRREGLVNKLLVVAPLSTLTTVWENEVFENFPHLKTQVLYAYSKKKRQQLLARPADIYVVNHEGVEVLHTDLWARTDLNAIVVDELAAYRNSRNARWKNLEPLVARSEYAWGLTGSPTPNAPTDAFGQSKLLTPGLSGYSFKRFKDSTMRQVGTFKWVERPEATSVVHGIMQPAVRFIRSECFDLPPTTYSTRSIVLASDAARHYKKMHDELATQIRNKEITAANEGVKLSKLLQISAGFAYDANGVGVYCGGVERFKEICEIIENASGKVIVLSPFRYFVDLLGATLGKLSIGNPKFSVAVVHGGTSKARRDVIYADFQKTPSPRVLCAHPATMAHGLTLTAADTVVWASPPTSLELYEQANARITRVGQSQNTLIVHVSGSKVEQQVYARLKRKAALQGALLEMFEGSTSSEI
jgi:SNF2 family DNA or RNA helicase